MSVPRLRVKALFKSYATPVLRGIDLEMVPGEVHALVGENGAGKTTLCRIICGEVTPDSGEMHLDGVPHHPRTAQEAEAAGVRMVRQELTVIGTLTVAENIYLNDLRSCATGYGLIRRGVLAAKARVLMDRVGLRNVDPNTPAGTLGVGQQQSIEIARALAHPCRLLILDEPTASLTERESDLLFEQIETLAYDGTSILYISHRLDEIKRICTRMTVLRDGQPIVTVSPSYLSTNQIVNMMVGPAVRDTEMEPPKVVALDASKKPALTVEGLYAGHAVRGVSFSVARGEILGFAGLVGAGRTETMRAIFAADPIRAGRIALGPERRVVKFRGPQDAVAAGLAFVTENRKEEGLMLPLSIRANMSLPWVKDFRRTTGGVPGTLDVEAEAGAAQAFVDDLRIRCSSVEQPVQELSGGSQQKVLIARWLAMDPSIFIFDEPTRGIDVGTRREIYKLLRNAALRGKAVIVVSSDLPELLEVCDRVAVMSQGRIVETFNLNDGAPRNDEMMSQRILAAAFSGHLAATQNLSAPPPNFVHE